MNDKATDFDLEYKETVVEPKPKITSEEELPEKYRGKSALELAEMHLNAERVISRQGQEVSQLRKLADELLKPKEENAKAPEPVTVDEVFSDPNAAVEKIINRSDVAQKIEDTQARLNALEKGLGQQEFETRNPKFMEDVADEAFLNWVKANPARQELLTRLHYNYDFKAGDALWSMWKEMKVTQSDEQADKRKEKLMAARTVRSSPVEAANKPVYSRAKLLELQAKVARGDATAKAKWNDPGFQKEYLAAYAEGRVR